MHHRLSIVLCAATLGVVLFAASTVQAQDCTPPRILLIMDRSSSMVGGGAPTKWDAAQDAIHDVLTTYGDGAQYGLMLFPGDGGGCDAGTVEIDVAAGTAPAIDAWIGNDLNEPPAGGNYTPAGQTLMTAAMYAEITNPAYDNYVVFVTDGHQWCDYDSPYADSCVDDGDCSLMSVNPCPHTGNNAACDSDTGGCYCVANWPVLGAEALSDAGVTTYVVGFGTGTNEYYLNQTADAGGAPLPNCDPEASTASCYYQANVSSELTAALGQIMHQLTTETCSAECDIEGERSCSTDGWSDCEAPSPLSCTSTCGTPGTQECVNELLTECSSEADCGSGGSGTGGTGGTGGFGGTGGSGGVAAGDPGIQNDPEDEGGCGCRSVGQQGGTSGLAALGLLLGLAGLLRARRED